MKQRNGNKKLNLNKSTVSDLQLNNLLGGTKVVKSTHTENWTCGQIAVSKACVRTE
ncbi:MAG: hypothetical protein GY765_15645 [bacterium]|nr:hypothetical protein [bacterium]